MIRAVEPPDLKALRLVAGLEIQAAVGRLETGPKRSVHGRARTQMCVPRWAGSRPTSELIQGGGIFSLEQTRMTSSVQKKQQFPRH